MYWWEAQSLKEATNLLAYQSYYGFFGDYFYSIILLVVFFIGSLNKNIPFGLFNVFVYYIMFVMLNTLGYIPMGTGFKVVGGILQIAVVVLLSLLVSGGFL